MTAAAAPALGRVVTLRERALPPMEVRAHPRGAAGIRQAMAWMVERIADDARHPLVIEWARGAIAQASLQSPRGFPDVDAQVRAVFARFKRETIFVRDPVDTEAIGSTVQVLNLDPNDLQLHGGDCDDLVRSAASCLLALGIPVRLDLRYYPGQNQAHIVVGYDSDPAMRGRWSCLDPSVDSGRCSTAAFTGQILMEVVMGTLEQPGTFIGMGAPLEDVGTMGAAETQLQAPDVQAWTQILTWLKAENDFSLQQLQQASAAYTAVRSALGLPQYDTATVTAVGFGATEATPTSTGPLHDYFTAHQWTAATQTAETQLVATSQFVSSCLADALDGTRATYWNNGDVLIASKPGDPYRLAFVTDASGNQTIQYLDASGTSTGTMGLGLLDILVGGAVIAAVTAAVAWATVHYVDYLRSAKHDDALSRIADQQQANVQSGTETPAQAQAMLQAATGFASAGPPSSSPPSMSLGSSLAIAAIGVAAGVAGAIYLPRVFAGARAAA